MKNLKFLPLLLIIIIAGSCSVGNDEPILTIDENLMLDDAKNLRGSGSPGPNPIEFQFGMAWTSYITGKVLFDTGNTSERNYFSNNYGSPGYVSMDDLLGNNPVHSGFKSKFIAQLQHYIEFGAATSGSQCPGVDDHNPGEPIVDGGDLTPGEYVQFFLDFLLSDNCVELYFPDGINFTTNEITTVAHPLDNKITYANWGVRRDMDGDCGEQTVTAWVTPNYIYTGNVNIIVARPYRDANQGCNYWNYPFDFTTFLQGPY